MWSISFPWLSSLGSESGKMHLWQRLNYHGRRVEAESRLLQQSVAVAERASCWISYSYWMVQIDRGTQLHYLDLRFS